MFIGVTICAAYSKHFFSIGGKFATSNPMLVASLFGDHFTAGTSPWGLHRGDFTVGTVPAECEPGWFARIGAFWVSRLFGFSSLRGQSLLNVGLGGMLGMACFGWLGCLAGMFGWDVWLGCLAGMFGWDVWLGCLASPLPGDSPL
ncbi:hypothetical protein SV7mr_06940 [Stieleria bergensis]|uniref:Uncharacterized protein n=1 Tax=Stieleria bergensis TaxID=2528025 RepID=A0A517SQ05_9BACT|nr:hypothetical protein SV7mr_06940 [Planctomycetes bacterium SV_7m_r]